MTLQFDHALHKSCDNPHRPPRTPLQAAADAQPQRYPGAPRPRPAPHRPCPPASERTPLDRSRNARRRARSARIRSLTGQEFDGTRVKFARKGAEIGGHVATSVIDVDITRRLRHPCHLLLPVPTGPAFRPANAAQRGHQPAQTPKTLPDHTGPHAQQPYKNALISRGLLPDQPDAPTSLQEICTDKALLRSVFRNGVRRAGRTFDGRQEGWLTVAERERSS